MQAYSWNAPLFDGGDFTEKGKFILLEIGREYATY